MAGSHKVPDLRHRGCQPSVDGCFVRPQILLVKGDTFTYTRAMKTVCTRKSPAFTEYYIFAVSPDRTQSNAQS